LPRRGVDFARGSASRPRVKTKNVPMRRTLEPRLVNDRFGDAALLVEVMHARRFLLFDCGDMHALDAQTLRLLSDVFLSHAHLDHLIGFDHVLRELLGITRTVRIFGPPGTAGHIAAKLQGYSWNLGSEAAGGPDFIVHDCEPAEGPRPNTLAVWSMRMKDKFAPVAQPSQTIDDGRLLADGEVWVEAAVLDHRLPCLGYAFGTPPSFPIDPARLAHHGLRPGRWVGEVSRLLAAPFSSTREVTVQTKDGPAVRPLAWLRDHLFEERPGSRFAYVTDALDSPRNRAAIVALAGGADTLFIEAGFADEDIDIAAARFHLTARAAGQLAAQANVAHIEPFHFSERYRGREAVLFAQLEAGFRERARLR
jgi:ribonuclease Z